MCVYIKKNYKKGKFELIFFFGLILLLFFFFNKNNYPRM